MSEIVIVFDGPPGPVGSRFIDIENKSGASLSVGDWVQREDGKWALVVTVADSAIVPPDCRGDSLPARKLFGDAPRPARKLFGENTGTATPPLIVKREIGSSVLDIAAIAHELGTVMVVTGNPDERRDLGESPIIAMLAHVGVKDSPDSAALGAPAGRGIDVEFAILDYIEKLQGKTLVYSPPGGPRREIVCPAVVTWDRTMEWRDD